MKILKKLTAVVMAAVMSAAMLTACSGGGGNGGITTKKISYSESRMAAISSTDQLYMEWDDTFEGQKTYAKIAAKGNNTYVAMYKDKQIWQEDITQNGKGYIIIYPDNPNYDYKDASGLKNTVPVYSTYEGTQGKGIDLIWGEIDRNAEVETGQYTIAGKTYYSEKIDGNVYCFDGKTIKAYVEAPDSKDPIVTMIYNFRNTNVPDSLFELPGNAVPVG